MKQYRDNVQNSYEYSLETLIERQIEDFIVSVITTKYDYSVYQAIDGADLQETISQLTSTYEQLKANQDGKFQHQQQFCKFHRRAHRFQLHLHRTRGIQLHLCEEHSHPLHFRAEDGFVQLAKAVG